MQLVGWIGKLPPLPPTPQGVVGVVDVWKAECVAATSKGAQGTSTGGVEYSPAKRRKLDRKRRAEEKSWRGRNGAVSSRAMTDEERALHFGAADSSR